MEPHPATPNLSVATDPVGASSLPTLRQGGRISSNREVAVVQADYLALANDLEQAQSLASALEMQLSGKTNELAQFKVIWERTQADLVKFAQDLDTMRKERHALANDAQRGYAYELKLQKLQVVHDELIKKADRLESELVRERASHMQSRVELEQLQAQREAARPVARGGTDPELRAALEALRTQLDRVLGGGGGGAGPVRPAAKAAPEHIDIEFGA